MKIVAVMFALFALAASKSFKIEQCPTAPIQENVDPYLLANMWEQRYFSPDGLYDDMDCFTMNYTNIDTFSRSLTKDFEYIRNLEEYKKNQEGLVQGTKLVTWKDGDQREGSADGKDESSEKESKEEEGSGEVISTDLMATDYENYLMLFKCKEQDGMAEIEVEVYTNGNKLDQVKEDINNQLKKFSIPNLASLRRIKHRQCRVAKQKHQN